MCCGFPKLRNKPYLAVAFACLLCCVTVAQTVRTSHAAGVDFSKYRTYRWVGIKSQHLDPNLDAQIKDSIDSQLATKGLKKADDAADLNVDYQIAISQVETWQSYEDWSDPSLLGQRVGGEKKVTIDVGTLALDMYDAAAKQLVWTGRANKTIDSNSSPEDRKKNFDKAAKKLFENFPPK